MFQPETLVVLIIQNVYKIISSSIFRIKEQTDIEKNLIY